MLRQSPSSWAEEMSRLRQRLKLFQEADSPSYEQAVQSRHTVPESFLRWKVTAHARPHTEELRRRWLSARHRAQTERRLCGRALAMWLHWRSVKSIDDATIADAANVRRVFDGWASRTPPPYVREADAAKEFAASRCNPLRRAALHRLLAWATVLLLTQHRQSVARRQFIASRLRRLCARCNARAEWAARRPPPNRARLVRAHEGLIWWRATATELRVARQGRDASSRAVDLSRRRAEWRRLLAAIDAARAWHETCTSAVHRRRMRGAGRAMMRWSLRAERAVHRATLQGLGDRFAEQRLLLRRMEAFRALGSRRGADLRRAQARWRDGILLHALWLWCRHARSRLELASLARRRDAGHCAVHLATIELPRHASALYGFDVSPQNVVIQLTPGSDAAARGGMRYGDRIIGADGVPLRSRRFFDVLRIGGGVDNSDGRSSGGSSDAGLDGVAHHEAAQLWGAMQQQQQQEAFSEDGSQAMRVLSSTAEQLLTLVEDVSSDALAPSVASTSPELVQMPSWMSCRSEVAGAEAAEYPWQQNPRGPPGQLDPRGSPGQLDPLGQPGQLDPLGPPGQSIGPPVRPLGCQLRRLVSPLLLRLVTAPRRLHRLLVVRRATIADANDGRLRHWLACWAHQAARTRVLSIADDTLRRSVVRGAALRRWALAVELRSRARAADSYATALADTHRNCGTASSVLLPARSHGRYTDGSPHGRYTGRALALGGATAPPTSALLSSGVGVGSAPRVLRLGWRTWVAFASSSQRQGPRRAMLRWRLFCSPAAYARRDIKRRSFEASMQLATAHRSLTRRVWGWGRWRQRHARHLQWRAELLAAREVANDASLAYGFERLVQWASHTRAVRETTRRLNAAASTYRHQLKRWAGLKAWSDSFGMAQRLVSTPRRVGRDRVLRHALTALSDHAAGRVACAIRAHAAARLGARANRRRALRWWARLPAETMRVASAAAVDRFSSGRRGWRRWRGYMRRPHLATAPLRLALASQLRLEHGMRRWAAGCAWAADEARRERERRTLRRPYATWRRRVRAGNDFARRATDAVVTLRRLAAAHSLSCWRRWSIDGGAGGLPARSYRRADWLALALRLGQLRRAARGRVATAARSDRLEARVLLGKQLLGWLALARLVSSSRAAAARDILAATFDVRSSLLYAVRSWQRTHIAALRELATLSLAHVSLCRLASRRGLHRLRAWASARRAGRAMHAAARRDFALAAGSDALHALAHEARRRLSLRAATRALRRWRGLHALSGHVRAEASRRRLMSDACSSERRLVLRAALSRLRRACAYLGAARELSAAARAFNGRRAEPSRFLLRWQLYVLERLRIEASAGHVRAASGVLRRLVLSDGFGVLREHAERSDSLWERTETLRARRAVAALYVSFDRWRAAKDGVLRCDFALQRTITMWRCKEQRAAIRTLLLNARRRGAPSIGDARQRGAAMSRWGEWAQVGSQMALWARLGAQARWRRLKGDAFTTWRSAPRRSQAAVMASAWGHDAAVRSRRATLFACWRDLGARGRVRAALARSAVLQARLRWWRYWSWHEARGERMLISAERVWSLVHARRGLRRWRAFASSREVPREVATAPLPLEGEGLGNVLIVDGDGGGGYGGCGYGGGKLITAISSSSLEGSAGSSYRSGGSKVYGDDAHSDEMAMWVTPLVVVRHADRARSVAFDKWLSSVVVWVRGVRMDEKADFCAARFRLQQGLLQLARQCVRRKSMQVLDDTADEVLAKRALSAWSVHARLLRPADARERSIALLALSKRFWALRATFVAFMRLVQATGVLLEY